MPLPTQISPAFATPLTSNPLHRLPVSSRTRLTRPPQPRRAAPTAKMVRVSVPLCVEAPADYCHRLFSDLSLMSDWSSTLESVTRDTEDPIFSEWIFSWNGIRLSWRARDEDQDHPPPGEDPTHRKEHAIRWRSVSGLTHIGAVEFFQEAQSKTRMIMTVDYDIASLLAVIMESGMVSSFVESAIQNDLQRFRTYTLRSLRKERITEKRKNSS